MPAGIGYVQRPFVHPRRLNAVSELLRKDKKNPTKSRTNVQRRPSVPTSVNMADPVARMAWQLHNARRQRYLIDVNNRLKQINGNV